MELALGLGVGVRVGVGRRGTRDGGHRTLERGPLGGVVVGDLATRRELHAHLLRVRVRARVRVRVRVSS